MGLYLHYVGHTIDVTRANPTHLIPPDTSVSNQSVQLQQLNLPINLQGFIPQHCTERVNWQIKLANIVKIPTEASLCLYPPVSPPLQGSMGHQLLPTLNNQGRTIDAILPDGNCLFRSISKALFGTSSGHLHLRKLIVAFIRSNSKLLGGLCNPPSMEEHCKHMEKPGKFATQAELQAMASLFQVPVYLFQKPNETRDWEWMVYSPQPKKRLNYTVCPGLETVKPPSTFDIKILYHGAHFDVIRTSSDPRVQLPFPHLPRTSCFIDLST